MPLYLTYLFLPLPWTLWMCERGLMIFWQCYVLRGTKDEDSGDRIFSSPNPTTQWQLAPGRPDLFECVLATEREWRFSHESWSGLALRQRAHTVRYAWQDCSQKSILYFISVCIAEHEDCKKPARTDVTLVYCCLPHEFVNCTESWHDINVSPRK